MIFIGNTIARALLTIGGGDCATFLYRLLDHVGLLVVTSTPYRVAYEYNNYYLCAYVHTCWYVLTVMIFIGNTDRPVMIFIGMSWMCTRRCHHSNSMMQPVGIKEARHHLISADMSSSA